MTNGRHRKLGALNAALAELSRGLRAGGTPDEAFARVTKLATATLDVDRGSIWLFDEDGQALTCALLHDRRTGAPQRGQRLQDVPIYLRALSDGRALDAPDAVTDPRTAELVPYLEAEGIGALLDSPIHAGARRCGVVCVEHVGGPRVWTEEDKLFVASLADIVGLTLSAESERQAHARLERSESLYRSLVEDQHDFLLRSRPDGRIVFANRALREHVGLVGQPDDDVRVMDFVPPDERPIVLRALASLTPEHPIAEYTHRLLRAGREPALVEWRLRAFFDEAGEQTRYQAVGRDVTHARLQAELLREAHRLEDLALLAGGVAHDVNNILTPIAAYADLALRSLPRDRPEIDHMRKILAAARRGQELTRHVSIFSRREDAEARRPLRIGTFIEETVAFTASSRPPRVDVQLDLEPDLVVTANPSDIYQIVSNLVGNAVQAIGPSRAGTIRITTRRTAANELQLVVEDDGPGMSPDVLARVFEPFFTTRPGHGGTGLGLPVVRGMVQDLGGRLHVQSAEGEGARFTITLPTLPPLPQAVPNGTSQAGKLRTLIVEDEPAIGEFVALALRKQGFRAEAVLTPAEALQLLAERPFELLVTDLTMPGMSGLELARRALSLQPELPILLISGYSDLLTPDELRQSGIRDCLAKPFTVQQLFEAVERVLESDDPSAPVSC